MECFKIFLTIQDCKNVLISNPEDAKMSALSVSRYLDLNTPMFLNTKNIKLQPFSNVKFPLFFMCYDALRFI